MSEATDLLSRFFADKAISGDPITPEESEWIQNLLTPSQSQASHHQPATYFDDSQSVVFQGEPEPNCFLSQSTFGFSQPSTYDSQEVLRKYQHYYSASQEIQPSQLSRKKPQSTPKPLLASLDSQRVLTPILETFRTKREGSAVNVDKEDDVKVEKSVAVQTGLTSVASAIVQILGDSGKHETAAPAKKVEAFTPSVITVTPASSKPEVVKPDTVKPAVVTPAVATPAFPMTPSPAAVVKPFIMDTPNDSEAFPKRIRTAEPEVATPVKNNATFSFVPATQPSQPTEPSLPVFEFHSPSSGQSQSDNNSLKQAARRCSSGELPEFVF